MIPVYGILAVGDKRWKCFEDKDCNKVKVYRDPKKKEGRYNFHCNILPTSLSGYCVECVKDKDCTDKTKANLDKKSVWSCEDNSCRWNLKKVEPKNIIDKLFKGIDEFLGYQSILIFA